jgi:hypothetical protein
MGAPNVLKRMEQGYREWIAWRQICKQLEVLGIVVNAETTRPLAAAIKMWGEELVALRDIEPKHKPLALEDCRDSYAEYWLPLDNS